MSEIQFYGNIGSSDKAIPGALAQAWAALQSNSDKVTSALPGSLIPYLYIMDLEEAREVNTKSFSWPLRVWVSQGEQLYRPAMYANNSAQFRKILDSIEGEEAAVVVTRTPPKMNDGLGHFYFYLARDTFLIQNTAKNGAIVPVDGDFSPIFKSSGLNPDYVYRLVVNGNRYAFDGIIERNNPMIDQMIGSSISESSEEIILAFRQGFFSGFRNDNYDQSRFCYMAETPIPVGNFKLSENERAARNSGIWLGRLLAYRMSNTFGHLISSNDNIANKVKLLANSSGSAIQQYKSFSKLHNAIVEDDREAINKEIASFFGDASTSGLSLWDSLKNYATYLGSDSMIPLYTEKETTWDNYDTILNVDEDIEFEVKQTCKFKLGQFRITNPDPNNFTVRFQVPEVLTAEKVAILSDGKKVSLGGLNKSGVELDFVIPVDPSTAQELGALNFCNPSNAGTKQMYAPVVLQKESVICKEKNLVLCTKSHFLQALASRGYIS